MVSSMTGINGSVSQANYAAGNSFVVLGLGPVSSVGFVAEADDDVRARVARALGSSVLPRFNDITTIVCPLSNLISIYS